MSDQFSVCAEEARNEKDWVRVSIFGRYGVAPGVAHWHKHAIPPIEQAVTAALKTQYGQQLKRDGIIWTLACRAIRGSTSHSEHAHPIALDINPPTNPMSDMGILHTDFHRFGRRDGANFVNAFIDAGFSWGGDGWTGLNITPRFFEKNGTQIRSGRVDPMHFEYDGPPVVSRKRVTWVLRFGGRKRVFRTFAKMLHFLRRRNRKLQRQERVAWHRKVEQEVVKV